MFELPLFPLNTVLFPGMPLRLHVFEERYKLMLQNVIKTSNTFGVNLIKLGEEALGPLPLPYSTGCTARIVQIEQLEDHSINLMVVGDERFRILRMGVGQPYLTAFVEVTPLDAHHTMDVVRGTRKLRKLVMKYLAVLNEHNHAGEGSTPLNLDIDLNGLQLPEDPMMLIYLSAALLQIPPNEKQSLLEYDTAAQLQECLQRILRRETAILPPLLEVNEEQARQSAWVN